MLSLYVPSIVTMRAPGISATRFRVEAIDNHVNPVCRTTSVGARMSFAAERMSAGCATKRMYVSCVMPARKKEAYP